MKRPREEIEEAGEEEDQPPREEAESSTSENEDGEEGEDEEEEDLAGSDDEAEPLDLDHDSDVGASSASEDEKVIVDEHYGKGALKQLIPAEEATIVVILEHCGLAPVKSGKGLLSCIDHSMIDNPSLRPDIVHHCLLALMDSPLSKAKRLRVLMNTHKGTCIEVAPNTRIPRTLRRFCGVIAQLINEGRVVTDEGEALFKTTPYGVSSHIPFGVPVIGLTNRDKYISSRHLVDEFHETGKKLSVHAYELPRLKVYAPCVYVISATDAGRLDLHDPSLAYVGRRVTLSQYDTNPSNICQKLTDEVERKWGIW